MSSRGPKKRAYYTTLHGITPENASRLPTFAALAVEEHDLLAVDVEANLLADLDFLTILLFIESS